MPIRDHFKQKNAHSLDHGMNEMVPAIHPYDLSEEEIKIWGLALKQSRLYRVIVRCQDLQNPAVLLNALPKNQSIILDFSQMDLGEMKGQESPFALLEQHLLGKKSSLILACHFPDMGKNQHHSVNFMGKCPKLRKMYFPSYCLKDKDLLVISSHCKDLREIDLSMSEVSDAGLKSLVSGCKWLKSIKLHSCNHVTDKGIEELVRCQHLTHVHVDVGGVSDQGLQKLAVNPVLESMYFSGRVTGIGTLEVFSKCAKIHSVCLADFAAFSPEKLHVFSRYKHLKHIEIKGEAPLLSLKQLTDVCPGLKHIALINVGEIRESHIGQLAKACTHMQKITVHSLFVKEDLPSLQQLSSLKALHVKGSHHGVFVGLSALIKNAPYLERLTIENVSNFQPNDLQALKEVSHVKELIFTHCDGITDTFLAELRQEHKSLAIQSINSAFSRENILT